MSCEHCAKAVTAEISKLPGVTDVDVDVAGGKVKITAAVVPDDADLRAAIDEAGYELVGLQQHDEHGSPSRSCMARRSEEPGAARRRAPSADAGAAFDQVREQVQRRRHSSCSLLTLQAHDVKSCR
jgi:copper chaperone